MPLFVSAAIALGILFTLAVIKWNEGATSERLRVHIQQEVYEELDLYGHLGARDVKVDIASTERNPEPSLIKVEGTLTIPRRRFAVGNNGRWSSFQPSGEVKAKFKVRVSLDRERIPFAPWLGPCRPVWRDAQFETLLPIEEDGQTFLVSAWNNAPETLDNALFDAHLSFEHEFDGHRLGLSRDAIHLIACRVLEGLGRPEEAASLASSITPFHLDDVLEIDPHKEIAHFRSLASSRKTAP